MSAVLRRQCAQTLRSLSSTASATPWFVDTDVPSPAPARPVRPSNMPPLPADTPPVLQSLHAELAGVPHLDAEHITVSRALMFMPGPPLPLRMPQGRRKRGGTYPGESMYDTPCGIWNWIVLAQVKEGTESRGTIESVVRIVRKMLLQVQPPLPLPPNAKRRMLNEWAMIDAGDFAVHVLSKAVRERHFVRDPTKEYYNS